MTFQCKHCGKRWDLEGFNSEHTFYTLCEQCTSEVIDTFALAVKRVNLEREEEVK